MDRDDPLYDLITNRQELYAKMISLVMLGGSVPVASLLCGITRHNLVEWRQIGIQDIAAKQDTYYSRFVNDINVAVLVPTIDAETVIHRKDPLEWLRSGPGRWVHPEGTWQAPAAKVAIIPAEPTVGIAEQSPDQLQDEEQLKLDAPTIDDLPGALQVLKDVGLGHVIDAANKKLEALERQDIASNSPETQGRDSSNAGRDGASQAGS